MPTRSPARTGHESLIAGSSHATPPAATVTSPKMLMTTPAGSTSAIAPETAMDRAEIVSLHATMSTPAGEFRDCLKTEETTPLEPDDREYKYYARGIGLVRDGSVKLVRYGKAE